MKPQLFMAVTLMVGLVLVAGCEDEQAPSQPVQSTAARPPAATVAPPQAATAAAPAEVKFVYQLEGRRDPFVPLIATKATVADFENPLEAFDLPQFLIKAVIVGMGETKAMVIAPDGRAYILKSGMRLGKANGIVKDINRQRVLVEEQYQDMTGKIRKNIQELKVPVREGV
jgi:type IV pilus assembly protein PilP